MVDLTLASSYVPALACVGKCLALCTLVRFAVPHGGTAAVGALLLVDRAVLNIEFIMDVNSVVAFACALAVFNVERQEHPVLPDPTLVVVSVPWAAVAMLQTARLTRIQNNMELCAIAVAAALAASSHAPAEAPQWMVARALGFSLAVVFVRYTREEEDLRMVLVRMGVLMLGPLVLCALVLCALAASLAWTRPPAAAAAAAEEDNEAQLFREALRQKGHLS